MGLFSKKPGGTFFGNLLRGVSNKVTGGLLGTGANMIPLPDQTVIPSIPLIDRATTIVKDVLGSNQQVQSVIAEGIWSKYKVHIIAAGLGLIALITWLVVRKSGGSSKRLYK